MKRRRMEPKCDKCDGQNDFTKYCPACKKAYCDKVLTSKVIEAKSGAKDIIIYCPECGAKSLLFIK